MHLPGTTLGAHLSRVRDSGGSSMMQLSSSYPVAMHREWIVAASHHRFDKMNALNTLPAALQHRLPHRRTAPVRGILMCNDKEPVAQCLREDGIAKGLRKFYWHLRYCVVITLAVLTPSAGFPQEFDATTYHLPLVLPGINRNHIWLDQLQERRLSAAVGPLLCANPIACENALPGTAPAEWSILEPGDSSILGFATEQSMNVGDTVHFKINTTAPSYHIDIF